jgi:nitrogen-specific signal transduction histidine kinase
MECSTVSPPVEALLDALPYASAIVGRDLGVVLANPAFEKRFGTGPDWVLALGADQADEIRRSMPRLAGRTLSEPASARYSTSPAGAGASWTVHVAELRSDPAKLLVVLEPRAPEGSRVADLEATVDELRKMKHEIASPLMGLVGQAELLASDPTLGPEPGRKVRSILDQARRVCDCLHAASQPVTR